MQSEFAFDFGQSRRNILLIIVALIILGHKPLLLLAIVAGVYYMRGHCKLFGNSDGKTKNTPNNIRSV